MTLNHQFIGIQSYICCPFVHLHTQKPFLALLCWWVVQTQTQVGLPSEPSQYLAGVEACCLQPLPHSSAVSYQRTPAASTELSSALTHLHVCCLYGSDTGMAGVGVSVLLYMHTFKRVCLCLCMCLCLFECHSSYTTEG